MPQYTDSIRDFGIDPRHHARDHGDLCASLSRGAILGQYLFTLLLSGIAISIAIVMVLFAESGWHFIWAGFVILGGAVFVYVVIRHDFRSIGIDGDVLRARHLYTGRILERRIDQIEALHTVVNQQSSVAARITDSWLGRVKGMQIRFNDGRSPMSVQISDPAMTNARELIETLLFRMSQRGELVADIVDWRGKPMIKEIHWKDAPAS